MGAELEIRIPERKKIPGVSYAATNDGVELPVVDITHPRFAVQVDGVDFAALRKDFVGRQKRRVWMPLFASRLLYKFLLRRSVIWRGLTSAPNRFLGGMNTYLLKIGPENLGEGYIGPGDRQIASSFPAMSMRVRVQTVATQLAQGLTPLLSSRPGAALHLVNIAGGHAADSLNALILIRRDSPALLAGRMITLHILDVEREAPDFGKRALAALMDPGAPLAGLEASLEYVRYNWSSPSELSGFLGRIAPGSVVAGSSEGGLFEYGSDGDIVANLRALGASGHPGLFIVGSVTRDDDLGKNTHRFTRIPVIPRGLAKFRPLLNQAGWNLQKAAEQGYCDVVTIAPGAPSH